MKILIAPDSFKGSLTALEVSENIEKGLLKVWPEAEVIKVPMADGGEGTVRSLVDATGGKIVEQRVTGPLGEQINSYYGLLGDGRTAVIEMANASGLPLVPAGRRNPLLTTTFGTGELIKAALEQGVDKLIIGIGGSATNDGGVGMAQALGIQFLDSTGRELAYGGGELARLVKIDMTNLDPRIKNIDIEVACDVDNPLYGPEGAAYVYGPQKGATPEMVKELDDNLRHYSQVVLKELNVNLQKISGAGAAGGLGAGLLAFLGAKLRPGIEIILKANKFEEKLAGVDLVITGEGKIDSQTINGKTPIGVAKAAKNFNIPVIALCGSLGKGFDLVLKQGIDAVFSITQEPVTLGQAVENTAAWLQITTEQIVRVFIKGGAIL